MNLTDAVYAELRGAFAEFNVALFDGKLPECLITLQRKDHRCFGYYSNKRFGHRLSDGQTVDEIALNPMKFKSHGPLEALQTLAHEMCHMWQYHFGHPSRKGYHNEEWARKMEAIGLLPSSTGEPGGARVGQKMADYVDKGGRFDFIAQKLLANGFEAAWYDRHDELLQEHAAGASLLVVGMPPVNGQAAGKPGSKSGKRVKYCCPKCKLNAWAKPDAKLRCGEDGADMVAA